MQETLAWLANPSNANPDALPPGLEGFDPVPYLSAAVPITVATFGTQMAHELGHRVLAYLRKVRRYVQLITCSAQRVYERSQRHRPGL